MQKATPLSRDEIIHVLETEYGITGNLIYLLDLVPLVEMLWSDGKNQTAEISLIYEFATKLAAQLANDAGGVEVVSATDITFFLQHFVHQRPASGLLSSLRTLTQAAIDNDHDAARAQTRKQNILDYCLDIAAASVSTYPYARRDRFIQQEKVLLVELLHSLHISPHTEVVNR
jgi:hypothetical protein